MIAFLLGPIGRWLLVGLALLAAIGGAYVKGRTDQHHHDDQVQQAAVARLAAENLAREQAATKVAADVAQAHGAAVQQIQTENEALQGRIRAARLTASVNLREACHDPISLVSVPSDAKPSGDQAAREDIDADSIVFGPDFLGLWNGAYRGAKPGIPAPRQPDGAVPAPGGSPARPPARDITSRAVEPPRAGSGGVSGLQRPGGQVDRLGLTIAEVIGAR